jgi:hypothetical protein
LKLSRSRIYDLKDKIGYTKSEGSKGFTPIRLRPTAKDAGPEIGVFGNGQVEQEIHELFKVRFS